MDAQEILEEVEREMKRKYDPEQQICELIKKAHPELQDSLKTQLEPSGAQISKNSGIIWLGGNNENNNM